MIEFFASPFLVPFTLVVFYSGIIVGVWASAFRSK